MNSLTDLSDRAKSIKGFGADAVELFGLEERSFEIDVRDGNVENAQSKVDSGIGIRIIRDSTPGFAFTADLTDRAIEEAGRDAIEVAKLGDKDKHLVLPHPVRLFRSKDYYDAEIATVPPQEKIERARKMEIAAKASSAKVKRTDIARYMDGETELFVVNTNGVAASYKKSMCGGFIDSIAEENGNAESGFAMSFGTHYKDFDAEEIGKEAGEEAAAFLGATPVPGGKYTVLLRPLAATAFLDFLAHALSADAIQKGKSPFRGKIGTQVGTEKFTLIDDPDRERAVGSQPIDTEGTPSRKITLIENGTLRGFIHNMRSASQEGTQSTGHAARGSYKTPPIIGPTNLFIQPGDMSREKIIGQTARGIILHRVIGAHTINPISGDFSVGGAGYLIENGAISRPTSKITFSGNLFEYLRRIVLVGNDLQFYPGNGNIGSGTIAIADGQISGL